MARRKRSDIFVADEVAVVHVMNRAVRGLFLLGEDPVSKKNYDYRRDWMEQRLQLQASCFAIDLLGFSILSNHFHQVLRSRPDISENWTNEEVARRWLTLCPEKRDEKGIPFDPTDEDIANLCRQKKKIKEYRKRLTDISWWMRLFNQTIAQRANREDKKEGSFWQGRFKAVRLLDEASLLACMAYVDLNPVRAKLAETLEDSRFTSAWYRLCELLDNINDNSKAIPADDVSENAELRNREAEATTPNASSRNASSTRQSSRGYSIPMARCLAPVDLRDHLSPADSMCGTDRYRCSDKGFLSMSSAEYLHLLDWTARQVRPGGAGKTPAEFAPLFDRLGITADAWIQLVAHFRKYFGAVAGRPAIVDEHGSGTMRGKFRLSPAARELLSARA